MSYYSPTHILTDAQKAPTTFDLAVPALSPLNNNTSISNGTKLDLPLWMAEMLAVSKPAGPSSSSLATLDMPSALSQKVMNALRADPKSVDLRAQAQWYYGLGERMLELFEEEEMVDVLTDVSFAAVPRDHVGQNNADLRCRRSRNALWRSPTKPRILGPFNRAGTATTS